MIKIEKVEFNAEETKTVDNFLNLVEKLIEMNIDSMENELCNIDRIVEDFFYLNPDIVLTEEEEEN